MYVDVVALSLKRRSALLEYARTNDAVIVEDDYDGEFRYGGRPLDALQTLDREARVFYVGTFSKSLFPSLRKGFVVVPAWAREAAEDRIRQAALQAQNELEALLDRAEQSLRRLPNPYTVQP